MNHYVYRTKRGLLRTVAAADPYAAWSAASKKHRPDAIWSLDGEAWMESSRGGCTRERAADIPPGHAQALYLDACAVELSPGAREHLRAGCLWTPSERRALHQRGLILSTGPRSPLTDLGRAFLARTEGGA